MKGDDIFSKVQSIFWVIVWICFVIFGILWQILSARYKNVIYRKGFEYLGFTSHSNPNIFDGFNISFKLQLITKTIYSGTYKDIPTSYLFFSINIDRNTTVNYHGVIFETDRDHQTLQIYDAQSNFAPMFQKDRRLESDEFNDVFVINAPSDEEAYYQLSPGAMQNLLQLKTKMITPFNIEFTGKKILIFGLDDSYNPAFNSISEVLTQKPTLENTKTMANNILFAMDCYWEIYQATLK